MNARSRFDAEAVSGVQSRRHSTGEDGAERPSPDSFTPGEVVAGKYALERVLGVGGVGVVLAARHAELDEMVAIKFLHPEMQRRHDIVRRFAAEARAAVRIKSEYAARVYDVGTCPERGPYLVMEYLQGKDLADVLAERGPLPVKRAVEFMMEACEALAVAHSNGIVHRDIKPENLFIARRGDGSEVVKVLDFGISKAALAGPGGASAQVAQTQTLMGSPLYMSPEQIRTPGAVDQRSDVWALGVVLYEMLTGDVPFPGDNVPGVCARILEAELPPLLAAQAPDGLEAVVARALEKDPAKRFQNVAEFAISLLPFGPSWASVSAERTNTIVRASGQTVGVMLKVLGSAPPPSSLTPTVPAAGVLRSPPVPQGMHWSDGPSSLPSARASADPEAFDALAREARRTRRVVTTASMGALALAALAVGLVLRSNHAAPPEAPAAAAPASAAPDAAAPAAEVTLSLTATPAEAKIFLDDKPLGASPLKKKFPRDGASHSVRAEAKGYATRSVVVAFDSDKEITIGLDRTGPSSVVVAAPPVPRGVALARRGAGATVAAGPPPASPPQAAPPTAAPPAAPPEPASKSVQEVELSKSKKPVRPIDTGNMW